MPCRNRNKEMGKEVAAPVTAPLATAETVVENFLHRLKVVEAAVWTENSKIVVAADG